MWRLYLIFQFFVVVPLENIPFIKWNWQLWWAQAFNFTVVIWIFCNYPLVDLNSFNYITVWKKSVGNFLCLGEIILRAKLFCMVIELKMNLVVGHIIHLLFGCRLNKGKFRSLPWDRVVIERSNFMSISALFATHF